MMRAFAGLAGAAIALTACESTRLLTATPAQTPPAGAYVRATLLLARSQSPAGPARPNTLYIQATDSLAATDSVPSDVASSSTVAILAGGAAYPLSAAATLPAAVTQLQLPALVAFPSNILPLLPRNDGTQEYHLLVKQRLTRTFPATISVLP